jgi:hypothetical protein
MRRQHWVDSRVQGTLVRRILLHWCAFFGVTMLFVTLMNVLLGDPAESLLERAQVPGSGIVLIGLIMLALFPAFALDTIRFSNRFVGPISRLRRYMRELAAGKTVPPLAFRDHDFWAEIADEFNAIARVVYEQREEIQSLKESLPDNRPAVVRS